MLESASLYISWAPKAVRAAPSLSPSAAPITEPAAPEPLVVRRVSPAVLVRLLSVSNTMSSPGVYVVRASASKYISCAPNAVSRPPTSVSGVWATRAALGQPALVASMSPSFSETTLVLRPAAALAERGGQASALRLLMGGWASAGELSRRATRAMTVRAARATHMLRSLPTRIYPRTVSSPLGYWRSKAPTRHFS